MAKNKGMFQFAANFEVKVSEALDPRLVAASKADLINKDNWPSDGDTIYVYKGLIVDCGDDGVYRLIDPAKALYSDYSGWQRIDIGGVKIDNIFTYKGNIESYDLLPSSSAEVGDVYNVEKDFTIFETTPLGDEISKHYYAGTNVAWNGTSWDPLTGSVDLSSYASKEEVSLLRTSVDSNAEQLITLNLQLDATNLELSNKVDKVEGSSLITNEKLELIDINANRIITLQDSNNDLNSRLSVVESDFNGSLKVQLANHEERLITLASDNSNNKENINNLLSTVSNQSQRLSVVEDANNKQTEQITNITISLAHVNNTVNTLTERIGEHTEELQLLKNSIPSAGSGLVIVDNKLEIKIDPSADNKLTITENGLFVTISEDMAEISDMIDDKISESFKWDNI